MAILSCWQQRREMDDPEDHHPTVRIMATGSSTLGATRKFYRRGLPPFLLADQPAERNFQEWMDSYWAKDIQELFRLDRRGSFLTFVELLLTSSGGIFEATRFARPSEVSTLRGDLAVGTIGKLHRSSGGASD
jgi:hypothetical protein